MSLVFSGMALLDSRVGVLPYIYLGIFKTREPEVV